MTKRTDDEEKTIPRPEGYTIVKYSEAFLDFIFLISIIVSCFAGYVFRDLMKNTGIWLFVIIFIVITAVLWVIGRKLTEVKVKLKITDEGLEQIRLSGSTIVPDYRLIKWEDMRCYYLNGRGRYNHFLISVKDDVNFRICLPLHPLFEKQKDNWENFHAFHDDFWGIAPEHDVHRAFFG